MQAIGLDRNPTLPWPVLIVVVAVWGAVLLFAITSRARGAWWRGLFLCAGYLFLLNPTLITEQREYLPDVVALVVDRTESQRTGGRLELTDNAYERLQVRLAEESDLELRSIVVDGNNKQRGTRLFEALQEVLSDVPPERVAGSIIITDGQVHDIPQRPESIARSGPIHVLLTGKSDEQDRRLVIEKAPS